MSNIETLANKMIPYMVKGIILLGIIMFLTSITIAAYSYLRKKQPHKKLKIYLVYTSGMGVLVSLSGVLLNFIANFDINFSSYKYSIPVGYIILLIVCILLEKDINQKN